MRPTMLFALLPAIFLAACSEEQGAVYPVKPDRAQQILSKADLPPVFGSTQILANKPSEVTWIVKKNGSEAMRYVATLTAAGDGKTRVALELKGVKSGPSGDVEKRLADNPYAKNLYLASMKERIDSAIEGRALDMTKVNAAFGGNMGAHLKTISNSADEAAMASEELDRGAKRR
jgi:hypothetical protein